MLYSAHVELLVTMYNSVLFRLTLLSVTQVTPGMYFEWFPPGLPGNFNFVGLHVVRPPLVWHQQCFKMGTTKDRMLLQRNRKYKELRYSNRAIRCFLQDM